MVPEQRMVRVSCYLCPAWELHGSRDGGPSTRPGSAEAHTLWVLKTHNLIVRASLFSALLARNLAACITIFQETNYKCFLISSTIHSPFLNQHRKQLS